MYKRQLFLFLTLLTSLTSVFAQKKALQLEDYKQWSRIVSASPSPDANYFSYALRPNGGDDTLYLKNLKTESVIDIPLGYNGTFSHQGAYYSYFIKPGKEETEKLKKDKKPVITNAYLLRLSDEKKFEVVNAKQMALSNDERFWAVLRSKPDADKSEHKGTDLVLYDLQNETSSVIGNVEEFAFNKKSSYLAYTVDAADKIGNGIFVVDLATKASQVLDGDKKYYSKMVWDDVEEKEKNWTSKGDKIAVLRGDTIDSLTQTPQDLFVFSVLKQSITESILQRSSELLPQNYVISDKSSLYFSDDGTKVFFGIKKQEDKNELSKDTIPNVDVWHYKDPFIQSVQIVRASRERDMTFTSVFHFKENKFQQLADEDLKVVLPSKHNAYKVGRNENPYLSDINWGISPADLYRIDVSSGERKKFAEEVNRPLGFSPDGNIYLYQKDSAIFAYDLANERTTNISENAPMTFMDLEHPYPHEKPTFGIAGWSANKKHVILNHKYDLYQVSLDGITVKNLTQIGEDQKIVFRILTLDKEQEWIDLQKPILLETSGEQSKKTGFYEVKAGNQPTPLVFEDMMYGSPQLANKSDKVFFTKQTFEKFPDFYQANTKFENQKQLTEANPQQENFAWGRRVLVDFENSKGNRLQGTLALPANYEEGKAYPTIIYFYEKMSDRHHQYSMPVYDDRPHMSTYASNGYMVFMPDIVFEEGRPGTSSLDAITAAANKLIELGYADKENIGLQGHSWSGYQTSFILTQTDIFKCVVTGAPPTNLESFYNNIYGSSGTVHHGIMEIGQVRMGRGVTPWTHREIYQRENPMHHIPNINTPFLILHGTKDGAVDWSQGLELFNAARRQGKEVIFLSYPGEGHHLSNEANQKDFQRRMKEYFDHHLKGQVPAAWITDGVPHLDKLYEKAN